MMTAGVPVPIEALATLRRRLAALPGHPQRETLLSSTAELYAISRATLGCCAASGASATRIALTVAPRASCRRQRSSTGARSSPP